jgi:hypothetical protein
MTKLSRTIKMALENTVMCRGGNGPKESYEYAERMEGVIKLAILESLEEAGNNPDKIANIIKDLKGE